MKKLILLDRDGVINVDREDSVKSISEFIFMPGIAESIARLNKSGKKVAVITNQSCVGRGIITERQLMEIHAHMTGRLKEQGAHIDAIYFAPDHPDRATPRRKPGGQMLIEAFSDFGVAAADSIMVGDALRDLQAAKNAGCDSILLRTGRGAETEKDPLIASVKPLRIFNTISEATDYLLQGV